MAANSIPRPVFPRNGSASAYCTRFVQIALLIVFCGFFAQAAAAQEVSEDSLMREEDPEALLLAELASKKDKKKEDKKELKQPKNVFYGIKTKKNFIKHYTTNGSEIEIFNYVVELQEPHPYLKNVQEVVYFNPNKRALQKTIDADKNDLRVLHGLYRKVRNGKVVEQGFYYLGGKHGRWEVHDENGILKNKERYYRGWPKEAEIEYYDSDRKKIKEMIPVHYGEKHGMYYAFYEGGQMQMRGRYEFGCRVGTWTEYYQFGKYSRMKKKETRYPKKPFDKTEPLVVKEWDEKGKLTYDRDRDGDREEKAENTEETEEKF